MTAHGPSKQPLAETPPMLNEDSLSPLSIAPSVIHSDDPYALVDALGIPRDHPFLVLMDKQRERLRQIPVQEPQPRYPKT